MALTIYLAGRMDNYGPDDWRANIVAGFEDVGFESYHKAANGGYKSVDWPILQHAIAGEHHYSGPYYMNCDHGCTISATDHGNGLSKSGCLFDIIDDGRMHINKLCMQAINNSDVVFAWVKDDQAYGTLFEVGYAVALGKTVVWCSPVNFEYSNELWFAKMASTQCVTSYSNDDPVGAFFRWITPISKGANSGVYLFRCGDFCKIGVSNDIMKRLQQLRTSNPVHIEHVHTIHCAKDDMLRLEKYLHERYNSKRVRGEWFSLSDEDVAEIRRIVPSHPVDTKGVWS